MSVTTITVTGTSSSSSSATSSTTSTATMSSTVSTRSRTPLPCDRTTSTMTSTSETSSSTVSSTVSLTSSTESSSVTSTTSVTATSSLTSSTASSTSETSTTLTSTSGTTTSGTTSSETSSTLTTTSETSSTLTSTSDTSTSETSTSLTSTSDTSSATSTTSATSSSLTSTTESSSTTVTSTVSTASATSTSLTSTTESSSTTVSSTTSATTSSLTTTTATSTSATTGTLTSTSATSSTSITGTTTTTTLSSATTTISSTTLTSATLTSNTMTTSTRTSTTVTSATNTTFTVGTSTITSITLTSTSDTSTVSTTTQSSTTQTSETNNSVTMTSTTLTATSLTNTTGTATSTTESSSTPTTITSATATSTLTTGTATTGTNTTGTVTTGTLTSTTPTSTSETSTTTVTETNTSDTATSTLTSTSESSRSSTSGTSITSLSSTTESSSTSTTTTIPIACPEDNINASFPLVFDMPICYFVMCPDPRPLPEGYVRDAQGEWRCADGYAGRPEEECVVCNASLLLRGCLPIVPCTPPVLPDPCAFEAPDCREGLAAGESCEVHCKSPFYGESGNFSCEADNTDPTMPAAGVLPDCAPVCPRPPLVPEAYAESGPGGSWECAERYVGIADVACVVNEGCDASLKFSGCQIAVNCSIPEEAGDDGNCSVFNVSECLNVPPGGSCELACVSPRVGPPVSAMCSSTGGQLSWTSPNCTFPSCGEEFPVGYVKNDTGWRCAPGFFGAPVVGCGLQEDCCTSSVELSGCYPNGLECPETCPYPSPVPPGYVMGPDGVWQCAPGYLGEVTHFCEETSLGCKTGPVTLKGCNPALPCTTLPLNLVDPCQYDVTDCEGGIDPGGSCYVTCKTPYLGARFGITSCPADNRNPDTRLELELPDCALACPAPNPVPAGYVIGQGGWQCSPGYTGTAVTSCSINRNTCGAVFTLTGCQRTYPCVLPVLDSCIYDTYGCEGLGAGESCNVSCAAPYTGELTVATCPEGNLDPTQVVILSPPSCECPDPAIAPRGYVSGAAGGGGADPPRWACSGGYDGAPVLRCGGQGDPCLSEPQLSGCEPQLPCGTLPFVDEDLAEGLVTGNLSFGPAAALGRVSEDGVAAYQVYFADACGEPLGTVLAEVPAGSGEAQAGCCEDDLYSIPLSAVAVPAGARQLLVSTNASFPAGVVVPLEDSGSSITPVPTPGQETPEPEALVLTMTVTGVSYDALMADQALRLKFEEAVKNTIALQASEATGAALTEEDITLRLSSGSIVVEATIVLPEGSSTEDVQTALSAVGSEMQQAVAQNIASVPGIELVLSQDLVPGENGSSAIGIGVDGFKVARASTTTTTTTVVLRKARAADSAVRSRGEPFVAVALLALAALHSVLL